MQVLGYNRHYPSAPEYITTLSRKFQLQRTRDSTERWGLWMRGLKTKSFIEKKQN